LKYFKDIIFIDNLTKHVEIKKKAIVILSPSFYWFINKKLDISLRQAKKIAPSIFEGVVPEGKYEYFIEKVNGEYWFFAYDNRLILDKLTELKIKPSQISKIYPAQIALQNITKPVDVGDKIAIKEDGVVIFLPKSLFPSKADSIKKEELFFPKKTFYLKAYNSAISEDILYKISILLFLGIVLYSMEIFLQKKDLITLQNKEIAIKKRYNLPPTVIQMKSIISSLKKIQKKQLDIRNKIDYILRIPLLKGEYITRLDISKNIIIEFVISDSKRGEFIKNYLLKKLNVSKITLDKKKLFVKCLN